MQGWLPGGVQALDLGGVVRIGPGKFGVCPNFSTTVGTSGVGGGPFWIFSLMKELTNIIKTIKASVGNNEELSIILSVYHIDDH